MLEVLAFAAMASVHPLVTQEPSAAYEVVLSAIQRDFPEVGLVLMTPLPGKQSAPSPDSEITPTLVEQFRERGLIVASCVPPRNTIGCSPSFQEPAGPTLKLVLFPIQWVEGMAQVRTTLIRVSDSGRLYVEQRMYSLEKSQDRWELAGWRVSGTS